MEGLVHKVLALGGGIVPLGNEGGDGAVGTPLQAGRIRNLTLVTDGEVHTESVSLKELRTMKGYATELGLYFEKNAGKGKSVVIQSIQFVSSEAAE